MSSEERIAAVPPPIAVILYEPRNPLNVGSVVRACRNTDVRDIRLVRPSNFDIGQAAITAPKSREWIEEHVRAFEEWGDAVAGLSRLYAFTARPREERQTRLRMPEVVGEVRGERLPLGLVFGREDHGLPNDIVQRCDAFVTFATSEEFTSLNLAQAVMLATHALFVGIGDLDPMPPSPRSFPAATHDALDRMMGQAERSLELLGFFKGTQRSNVLRTLRRVLTNARTDTQELATFWGIFAEIERVLARVDGSGSPG